MDVPVTRDHASDLIGPQGGVTRVPFRVFSDPAVYAEDQKRLFRGPIWYFLPGNRASQSGDWRLATIGKVPVVTRDEHGAIQIITRESHEAGLPIGILYCDSSAMMEDRVRALRTVNIYEPHSYRHLLGRPRFETQGDGFAVRSNFCVFRIAQDGDTVTFATGRYLDRIVEDDGALRFGSRRAVLYSRWVDILLVLPL